MEQLDSIPIPKDCLLLLVVRKNGDGVTTQENFHCENTEEITACLGSLIGALGRAGPHPK